MALVLPTYDSTKVQTLSATLEQQGTRLGGGNIFSDGNFPFTIGNDSYIGLAYNFSLTAESERSLLLAPRIPFTNVTDDLAGTSEVDRYWTLTLTTTLTAIPTGNQNIYGKFQTTPALWSNSNLPNSTTDRITYVTFSATGSQWVLSGTTYNIVFDLDFRASFDVAGTLTENVVARIVNDSLWSGRFMLSFRNGSSSNITVTAATFSGLTNAWHTGAIGKPMKRRARVVHDHITGQPYMSDEAIGDGFRDGIMVHPDNWDPEDPKDKHPYVPPPREGVIDDTITDLE